MMDKNENRAGDGLVVMAWWSSELAALPEDPSSMPRHTCWAAHNCHNSSSRELNTLFGPLQIQTDRHIYTHRERSLKNEIRARHGRACI